MRVLILTASGFEDSELLVPKEAIEEVVGDVEIGSLEAGPMRGEHGATVFAELGIDDIDPNRYDLLLLPGGKAPARLRRDRDVLALVRAFVHADKPIAAICHGPQILASAGVLAGRYLTCVPSISKEMRTAGARVKDQAVVVDGKLITSRRPEDLPAFVAAILEQLGVEATAV